MSDGDTLYAWQEQEPDGKWGIIAAIVPVLSSQPVPLVFRGLPVAHKVRALAQAHGQASGHPVRLARFDLGIVMEQS